ncbi:hypothetical protein [Streptomyces sp. SID4982]|uniref:hypothetical protein n=1 Tax=Streptomyces sp. SID4982 TaxID=2690291 RepID=UPI001F188E81|nr:hypothetical protein [Streptomyces sp. SID4982]
MATAADTSTTPAVGPAFALLGTVQTALVFTLTSLTVPLPRIGREFSLGRDDLALLSAAYGLAFSGLLTLGSDTTSLAATAVAFAIVALLHTRIKQRTHPSRELSP